MSELTDRDKNIDYEKFVEILDQSANNITPRGALPQLRTPISSAPKVEKLYSKNTSQIFDMKGENLSLPSTVKGDMAINITS